MLALAQRLLLPALETSRSVRLHIFLNSATTLKDVHFKIVDFEVARFNYHQEQAVATVVANVAACFYASFNGHISSGQH